MRPLLRFAGIASATATILLTASPSARACAACGCGDPSVSEIGIPDTDAGGAIAGVAFDARRDSIGGRTTTDTHTAAVGIWTLTPDLQLYFRAPFMTRDVDGHALSGIADADVGSFVVLFRERGISRGQSVTLQAQLTLPTGNDHGVGRDIDYVTGNGAAVGQFGLGWFGHYRAWRGYASAALRHTIAPSEVFTPGDARLFNLGVQAPLTSERIDWTLEINARDSSPDRWPLGTPMDDTGGAVAYLTPGILATLGPPQSRVYLRASLQLPFYANIRGSQQFGPVPQIGIFRSF